MTLSPLSLECFELEGAVPPPPSRDFTKGFEAGLAQASEALAAQKLTDLTAIQAVLSDMQFGYTEARLQLLEQIRPLLTQVAETVLPAVLKDTFAQHLSDTIYQTIDATMPDAVSLSVAPSTIEEIRTALPALAVVADADLDPGQAIITRPDTRTMIDTPALLDALNAALQGLDPLQRTQSHG
ncbi:hypothetical protein [Thalassorhabdomicrobium marinisediminis]|uniref:FliH/SctL family protein n=1 Tax=Thalassorhabdomicrobium marinisediminis TaxID=2170577 RepID=UPI0024902D50|nr:hypothetical protein [Thalassorhabdomicrobium marinisediminis]